MKKILLALSLGGILNGFNAQCTVDTAAVNAYLTSKGLSWGTMPDTVDNLPVAKQDSSYDEVIQVLWLDRSSQVEPNTDLQVNSIEILDITGLPPGISFVSASSTADDISFGGDGADASNGKWDGNSYGCIRLNGTPTAPGTYSVAVEIEARIGGLLNIKREVVFAGFKIVVDQVTSLDNIHLNPLKVKQNSPNPFSGTTTINYELQNSGLVEFSVMNLLGEIVHKEAKQSKTGTNSIVFNGSQLGEGVYMYSIKVGDQKVTKRMVIK